jgi:hypothetical protein
LQYLPSPHVSGLAAGSHEGTHWPPAQRGVAPLHEASLVHTPPVLFGWHAPFVQVEPEGHGVVASQPGMHWPFTQTSSSFCALWPHWLENWQVFCVGVHEPPTHERPVAQSVDAPHGQGPDEPPHAPHFPALHALPTPHSWNEVQDLGGGTTHLLSTQTLPPLQSPFDEHSLGATVVAGGEQRSALHTVPCGQSVFAAQVCMQPPVVHCDPLGQLTLPLHGEGVGAVSVWQP